MQIDVFFAFYAGLLSFFAPCTFAAFPILFAYFGANHKNAFRAVIAYAIGFIIVFIFLSVSIFGIRQLLLPNKTLLSNIGGFILIIMGLLILFGDKIPKISFLLRNRKLNFKPSLSDSNLFTPFILGVTNAFSWSPCVGPLLATIFTLAASSQNVFNGSILILSYGIGLIFPLIMLSLIFQKVLPYVPTITRYSNLLYKISGIIILIMGILFLFGFWEQIQLYINQYIEIDVQ